MEAIQIRFLLTRPLRDVTDRPRGQHVFSEFLLTRPLRDVTQLLYLLQIPPNHFYSHAPCGT